MTDIVECLERYGELGYMGYWREIRLMREAAEEIKRLRKELKMSWSLGYPEIKNATIEEATKALEANTAPQSIKDYVLAGIKGLQDRYGDDVHITVNGYGHLCEGKGSYDVTTATVDVRRGS